MLVAVTARHSLIHALRRACSIAEATGAPFLTVAKAENFAIARAHGQNAALLVVDLAGRSPHDDDDALIADVAQWKVDNAACNVVLVASSRDVQNGQLCYYLGRFATGPLVTVEQADDPNTWVDQVCGHPFAFVMEEVRADIASRLHNVPNTEDLLTMLSSSPRYYRVEDIAESFDPSSASIHTKRDTLRVRFRREGQAAPKEYLIAFRLLVFTKLKAMRHRQTTKWTPGQIAATLNCESTRQLARQFMGRTGYGVETLEQLPYEELRDLCVTLAQPGTQPLRELLDDVVRRVLRCTIAYVA